MQSMRAARNTMAALGMALAAALLGCGDDGSTLTAPGPDPSPLPYNPSQAIRLLAWSYNNRSLDRYREVFTDDFRWVCDLSDSSVTLPWSREAELTSARNLFLGGGPDQPRAHTIRLAFDRNLLVYPDPSAPWDTTGRWHRSTRTYVDLRIVTVEGSGIDISLAVVVAGLLARPLVSVTTSVTV